MKLLSDQQSLDYIHNGNDFTEAYFFGDYMRKITGLMKDNDEKWKLLCTATNIQNTDWASLDAYRQRLLALEKDITTHISTHENPFIL